MYFVRNSTSIESGNPNNNYEDGSIRMFKFKPRLINIRLIEPTGDKGYVNAGSQVTQMDIFKESGKIAQCWYCGPESEITFDKYGVPVNSINVSDFGIPIPEQALVDELKNLVYGQIIEIK